MIDQNEIEPALSYSGSYSDDVARGDIKSNSFTKSRRVIATSIEGTTDKFKNFNLSYNDRLALISGSAIKSKSGIRTKNFASSNEFYYDSFLPSPGAIGNINGALSPYISGTTDIIINTFDLGSFYTKAALSASTELNRKAMSEDSIHTWFSIDGKPVVRDGVNPDLIPWPMQDFVDVSWQRSPFAFQSKYKNLLRTLAPGENFPSEGDILFDTNGDSLTASIGNIKTTKIGSIYMVLSIPDNTFGSFNSFSQIWSSPTASNSYKHIFTKSWNTLSDVFWNPFIDENSGSNVFMACGGSSTLISSSNGIDWEVFAGGNDRGIQIDTGSLPLSTPSSISRIVAEGYNDSVNAGRHMAWYGIADGFLITSITKSLQVPNDGWTAIGVNFPDSDEAELNDIISTDPGGNLGILTGSLIVVGETGPFGGESGLISFAQQKNAVVELSWIRSTAGVANDSFVEWKGVTTGNTTFNYNFVCGEDTGPGVVNGGIIARATASLSDPHLETWHDITPTTTSLGITNSLDDIVDIEYNTTTNTLIAVANINAQPEGLIRSTDGGLNWTLVNGPLSFQRYGRIHAAQGTSNWYAIAAGGGLATGKDKHIHYSSDDGINWVTVDTEANNIVDTTADQMNKVIAGSRQVIDSSASLDNPPISVAVGDAIHNPINFGNALVDTSFVILRLSDAEFSTSNNINEAALVKPGEGLSGSIPIRPSVLDYNKAFFGFGDGINIDLSDYGFGAEIKTLNSGAVPGKGLLPSFKDFSMYDNYGYPEISVMNVYGPMIRGWKYGIYNGVPTQTNTVYRNGHYGQFRDMLEQRNLSKFLTKGRTDSKGGKITLSTSPVVINFISGTLSHDRAKIYLTASNPDFNPTDSGQFDYEYKSGQPFFDDVNLENFR